MRRGGGLALVELPRDDRTRAAGQLAVDRLLGYFADSREVARKLYRRHVQARMGEERADELKRSSILGGTEFIRDHADDLTSNSEIARRLWQPLRPALDELLSPPTDAAIAEAHRAYGYPMREIADAIGVHYATISRRIRRHESTMSERKT